MTRVLCTVPTPIPAELSRYALAQAGLPQDALPEEVRGQEHLLLDGGFAAHLAHMLGIPSPSPAEAAHLRQIARALREALADLPPEVAGQDLSALARYADALSLVAEVGLFQSRFLIEWFKRETVDRPLADQLGVTLEQLPMTVKLLKLAGRKSDGTPWTAGEPWS